MRWKGGGSSVGSQHWFAGHHARRISPSPSGDKQGSFRWPHSLARSHTPGNREAVNDGGWSTNGQVGSCWIEPRKRLRFCRFFSGKRGSFLLTQVPEVGSFISVALLSFEATLLGLSHRIVATSHHGWGCPFLGQREQGF